MERAWSVPVEGEGVDVMVDGETRRTQRLERLSWYAEVARLAPSKHNTQPWRFVVSDGGLDVYADWSRMLPATDPSGRELVLACGAAVRTAVVAAGAVGVHLAVTPFPEQDDGPLARLVERGTRRVSRRERELLAAVTRRRTDRGPLDGAALPPSVPFLLQSAAAEDGCSLRLVGSEGDRRTLGQMIRLADEQLSRLHAVEEELSDWVRRPEDDRHDGVPVEATRGCRSSYAAEFVQRNFSVPGQPSAHDREGTDNPVIAVLCTAQDRAEDWLRAGQALMTVLLVLTMAGGNASYINQPLELQHTRDLLRDVLVLPGAPQVVLRAGAGGDVASVSRRPVADVIGSLRD